MELQYLKKPLTVEQIDFRVQRISETKKGVFAFFLAYKDARADMNRLDEVVGPLNWKREHRNGNANCIVSVYDAEKKEWISKEDTGKESFSDKEKGLASDSFKRACFNWGIGRELYDYPPIIVKLNEGDYYKSKDKLKLSFGLKLRWYSEFKDGELIRLAAKDQNDNVRFNYKKQ